MKPVYSYRIGSQPWIALDATCLKDAVVDVLGRVQMYPSYTTWYVRNGDVCVAEGHVEPLVCEHCGARKS